jgi:hypothetical protein
VSWLGARRPSASTVLSGLALFAALGGVGYAAGTLGGQHQRASTLASGKSEKGVYSVQGFEFGSGQGSFKGDAVSYPVPLKATPVHHFIPEGNTPPAQCPGSATKPKAKPGHLCVYETDGFNRDSGDVSFTYGDARDKLGFKIQALSAAAQNGTYGSDGVWAVAAK